LFPGVSCSFLLFPVVSIVVPQVSLKLE
jgi:hypothetical protein